MVTLVSEWYGDCSDMVTVVMVWCLCLCQVTGGSAQLSDARSPAPVWEEDYSYCNCCHKLKLQGTVLDCDCVRCDHMVLFQATIALFVASVTPTQTMIPRWVWSVCYLLPWLLFPWLQMVQCCRCDHWVHARCEQMSGETLTPSLLPTLTLSHFPLSRRGVWDIIRTTRDSRVYLSPVLTS